jgi:hypothetical protein
MAGGGDFASIKTSLLGFPPNKTATYFPKSLHFTLWFRRETDLIILRSSTMRKGISTDI